MSSEPARVEAESVEVRSYTALLMGETFRIQLVADESTGTVAAEAAFAEARRLETLFSLWSGDSELSRWNRCSRETEAESLAIHSELGRVLSWALLFAEETGGAFDPTIGRVLRELGFYGDEPIAELDDANRERWKDSVGFEKISLRDLLAGIDFPTNLPEERYFVDGAPGVELDLSAGIEGYAANKMALALKNEGIATALICAGPGTAVSFGAGPHGEGWSFELALPTGQRTWWLRDEAISLSSQSSRTLPGANKGKSHVFDPRTLAPIDHGTELVIARGDDPLTCDIFATALLVMGEEAGTEWFRSDAIWNDAFREVEFYVASTDGAGLERRTVSR